MLLKLILTSLVSMFKENNITKADLEARLILEYIVGLNTVDFMKNLEVLSLNDNKVQLAYELAKRRISGEPLAYILQYKNFYKDKFFVDNRVLIPRADSETLIEAFLELEPNKASNFKLLDIGVGSGCLSLSLLKEYTNAKAVGVDFSLKALEVAQINTYDLKLSKRMKLKHTDIFSDNFLTDIKVKNSFFSSKFDYIISNPPYIDINDTNIQENVKKYEPHEALFAENNGLAFYDAIFSKAVDILNKNGLIFVEIGINQENSVIKIAEQYNLSYISFKKDIANIVRCLIFRV